MSRTTGLTPHVLGCEGDETPSPSTHGSVASTVRQKNRLANKRFIEQLLEQEESQQTKARCRSRCNEVEASSTRARFAAIVNHRLFSFVAASMVTLNALYMGVEATLRHCQDSEELDGWYAAQVLFMAFFAVELVLRLLAERLDFFQDRWNGFDAFLVATSMADTLVFKMIVGGAGRVDLLMVLRCLRLARLGRILRLLRFFKELWFLVEGIVSAARTLVWAWLLCFMMLYIAAVFSTSWIGKANQAGSELHQYFSDVPTSMYSLFQVMSVEGWITIARPAFNVMPWTALFFIVFLSATSFSILHVVVAIIVQNTLTHASNRTEEEASARRAKEQDALVKIVQIFELADEDGNGEVSREEFQKALENPEVVENLHKVNVDVRQAENLFDILDYDESGSLDSAEFVEGVMTARGEAESKDLLAMQCDLWKSELRIQEGICRFETDLRSFGPDSRKPLQSFHADLAQVLSAGA